MSNRPLNYTTKIAASITAGECLNLLAEAGADAVAVMLTDRQPSGLSFRLTTAAGVRDFRLPVDAGAMRAVLVKASHAGLFRTDGHRVTRMETGEHARNVAWRVARDWLAAQLALIAAGMAQLDQVMLPYLEVGDGRTMYGAYVEQGARMIEASR